MRARPVIVAIASMVMLTAYASIPAHIASADVTVTVVAAGDIACGPGTTRTSVRCHQADTAALVASTDDAVLAVGDEQYECGDPAAYQSVYAQTWGTFLDRTHPAVGDHEYKGATCATPGAAGYFGYFGDRATPLQPGCTAACGGYYSYDLGDWHVVVLNTNCGEAGVGGCTTKSPQGQWLAADLNGHPSPCTLVYMHSPYWANGKVFTRFAAIARILYAHGVDVLLGGDRHLYMRYAPQNPSSQLDDNGIRQFVVGTGGRSLSPPSTTPLPNLEVAQGHFFGLLRMQLSSTSYSWEFKAAGSAWTDGGTSSCH